MDLLPSSATIANLPSTILQLAIAAYLLSVRGKSSTTWLAAAYFTDTALSNILLTINGTVLEAPVLGLVVATVSAILLALEPVVLIQLAYRLPVLYFRREARLALLLSALVALGLIVIALIWAVYGQPGFSAATHSNALYSRPGNEAFLDGQVQPVADLLDAARRLLLAWAVIVFLRQTIQAARAAMPEPDGAPRASGWRGRLNALAADAVCIVRAPGRHAGESRALALLALVYALYQSGFIPAGPIDFRLVLVFAFAVIYMNNAREPTSFQVKLVGIPLVTTLLVLGFAAGTVVDRGETDYDTTKLAGVSLVREVIQTGAWDRVPPAVAYVASRPQADGEYSSAYTQLFSRDPTFRVDYLTENDARAKAVSVALHEPINDPPDLLTRDYRSRGIPEPYVVYHFAIGNTLYEVGYDYRAYRVFLLPLTTNVVATMVGAALLILLGFPLVFRISLLRPLDALRDGFRQVNGGDLTTQVPVQVEDEIGFLTRSFNGMVSSLKAAHEELEARNQRLVREISELRIEIDETKKQREVATITDTDFFRELQQKAQMQREKKARRVAGQRVP